MNKELLAKANNVFYFLEKEIARDSMIEWLEENNCTLDEWSEIRAYIAEKTGITNSYNNQQGY
jgi:hypothetical protein